jgi:hypothetical protein
MRERLLQHVLLWYRDGRAGALYCIHYPDTNVGHMPIWADRNGQGSLVKYPGNMVEQFTCNGCPTTCAENQLPQEVGAGNCGSMPRERLPGV